MPSTADAYASACAWLPAEIEITPRRFSSGDSVASLFRTPRGLNAPVRWKSSALKTTSAPTCSESVREPSIGVRCSRPAIRSRAASTSSSDRRSAAVATAADPSVLERDLVLALAAAGEDERDDRYEHDRPEVDPISHDPGYVERATADSSSPTRTPRPARSSVAGRAAAPRRHPAGPTAP